MMAVITGLLALLGVLIGVLETRQYQQDTRQDSAIDRLWVDSSEQKAQLAQQETNIARSERSIRYIVEQHLKHVTDHPGPRVQSRPNVPGIIEIE